MSRIRIPSRLRCNLERLVKTVCCGPPDAGLRRPVRKSIDGRRLEVTVEPDCALIACHAPRAAGAGVALALADRVASLLRGRCFGPLRFGSPSVDLDGRDPDGFRAVVTMPIRYGDGARPSRPPPSVGGPGTAAWSTIPGT